MGCINNQVAEIYRSWHPFKRVGRWGAYYKHTLEANGIQAKTQERLVRKTESHLESKGHSFPHSITRSPLHLLCSLIAKTDFSVISLYNKEQVVVKGLSSTTDFASIGQRVQPCKESLLSLFWSQFQIPGGIKLPNLKQMSKGANLLSLTQSRAMVQIQLGEHRRGSKEKEESL